MKINIFPIVSSLHEKGRINADTQISETKKVEFAGVAQKNTLA